jgi:ribose transport system permease protein
MDKRTTGGAAASRTRNILNAFGPALALILVYGFFSALNARMLSFVALETIIQQTVIVGVAAIGMTLVIVSAGIDLSVGSIVAFGSVAAAYAMTTLGFGPEAGLAAAILAGAISGLANGVVITRFKLVPFIVTLGSLLVIRGAAKGMSDSMPINLERTWLGSLLASLPEGWRWALFPPGAWLMIALAVLTTLALRHTATGRHIYAIGSNERTARLCGVPVERVKTLVYAVAGAFAGLSGAMLASYQEQGDPTAAVGLELDVIAAVVIGGGSLSGGEGSVVGSLVGAMIMTTIRVGCQLNGFPPWVTQIVGGGVIVAAVAVDRVRRRDAE